MSSENEVINSPSNNQVWLTSFGDLLTLLLSFFIAVIALSPLNPAVKDGLSVGKHEINSVIEPRLTKKSSDGTYVAKLSQVKGAKRGLKSLLLRFSGRDFVLNRNGFRRMAERRLRKAVSLGGYATGLALVGTCSTALGEDAWSRSEEYALALRRQLIDAGVKSAGVKMQVFGPHCQRVGSEGTLATVSFSSF